MLRRTLLSLSAGGMPGAVGSWFGAWEVHGDRLLSECCFRHFGPSSGGVLKTGSVLRLRSLASSRDDDGSTTRPAESKLALALASHDTVVRR